MVEMDASSSCNAQDQKDHRYIVEAGMFSVAVVMEPKTHQGIYIY